MTSHSMKNIIAYTDERWLPILSTPRTFSPWKVGRMHFLSLGVKGLKVINRMIHLTAGRTWHWECFDKESSRLEAILQTLCGHYKTSAGHACCDRWGLGICGLWWSGCKYSNWKAPGNNHVSAISTEISKYCMSESTQISQADLCDVKRCSCVFFP